MNLNEDPVRLVRDFASQVRGSLMHTKVSKLLRPSISPSGTLAPALDPNPIWKRDRHLLFSLFLLLESEI